MKIKLSNYQNQEIQSILYNIQKKNNNQSKNNKSNKIYKDVLLNNLYQIFTEIYQKQAIYYFANLFIEPVIFYNQENDHYIPIFHFSFFEYIFLDKSNHDEIEKILNEMKSVGYYLIYNPYFIHFYKKYQYIYQFIYQQSFQNEVYVETEGGSIEEDLSKHLESNPYYEDYLSSDFKHDFLNFGRSKLTLSSYQKIEKYLNGNSETHFFKRVFADLIQMKRLKNKYFLCKTKSDVGIHFYGLLQTIYMKNQFYIIQDAGAISFFYLEKETLDKIKRIFEPYLCESIGVYIDPSTPYRNDSNSKSKSEERYIFHNYEDICSALFGNMFDELGLKIDQVCEYGFNIFSPFTISFFQKGYNTLTHISRFLEYILSNKAIYQDIEDQYKREEAELAIKIKALPRNEIRELKKAFHQRVNKHIIQMRTYMDIFLSAMTYILINHPSILNRASTRTKKMIFDFLATLDYTDTHIYKELRRGKIRKSILSYQESSHSIIQVSLFENMDYKRDICDLFQNHISNEPIFFKIVLFFSRFKLIGDLLQLIEVDPSLITYRKPFYKNKIGHLITQDRMLGTYAATYQGINFVCKQKMNDHIYLFYRL